MKKYFGTDGIRGIANEALTNELVYRATIATIDVLSSKSVISKKFLIGKDTRISSDMFEATITSALLSKGIDVVRTGVVPTPAISCILKNGNYLGGVMISASHNSFEYNGIKFFNSNGYKLSDEIELKIEEKMQEDIIYNKFNENLGRLYEGNDLINIYKSNILKSLDNDFKGIRVLIDCANGVNYKVAEKLFLELGVNVDVMSNEPNGININYNCGSTHLENLQEKIKENAYDFGFAYDGDADRVLCIDKNGNLIDGDKIAAIIALNLKSKNMLNSNKVVLTKMSNLGVINYLKSKNIDVELTDVGDRYVLECMLNNNYVVGAEQSGHIILSNFNNTGDGLLSSAVLIDSIISLEQDLHVLGEEIVKYPQKLTNIRITEEAKKNILNIDAINNRIKQIEKELAGEGRVFIRLSGTEPLLRVMIEAKDKASVEKYSRELEKLYNEYI